MPKAKQFVTDENGVRVAVMLDIKEYEELLEDLEDLQAVREYEEEKASGQKPIPLAQALDEIRRNRK
jgi:hypothetical protein